MTHEELSQVNYASREIVKLSEELLSRLQENSAMIDDKRVSNAAVQLIVNDVANVLNQLVGEIKTGTDAPEQKLGRVAEFLVSFIGSLQASQRTAEDELIRLIATQDGMRRALEAVRETGSLRIQEVERIERLAQQEDPEARRPIGARPETVAAKRNAKALKKSQADRNS